MANSYSISLLGVMDRLWFHQIILFSEPTSLLSKNLQSPELVSQNVLQNDPSPDTDTDTDPDPETDPSPTTTIKQSIEADNERKEVKEKERPTRANQVTSKARSQSSSPSKQKRPKTTNLRFSNSMILPQTKSPWELELEEVKGFMDLGFTFKKEHLSPRMMSVVPGLQRLNKGYDINDLQNRSIDDATASSEECDCEVVSTDDDEIEEEMRGVTRPYLSEAWSSSPLLNLRIPRVSTAADMKKHLRFWARTVATVIVQESWER
ncbi:hypothetical protein RJ641_028207 [Dillenia turbinata]|uniref:Uncharacterized protein n=1 Tax=Dillenia turbinata TaxID=194707 RepID=A0AAN8VYP1_9MAGN